MLPSPSFKVLLYAFSSLTVIGIDVFLPGFCLEIAKPSGCHNDLSFCCHYCTSFFIARFPGSPVYFDPDVLKLWVATLLLLGLMAGRSEVSTNGYLRLFLAEGLWVGGVLGCFAVLGFGRHGSAHAAVNCIMVQVCPFCLLDASRLRRKIKVYVRFELSGRCYGLYKSTHVLSGIRKLSGVVGRLCHFLVGAGDIDSMLASELFDERFLL